MAVRRKGAKADKGRRKGKAKKASSKKAKKAKKEKVVKPGPPVEVVMCIVTGIMLIAALVLIDYATGLHLGDGMMFSDQYTG
jgi:hypothetical protein